MTRQVKDPFSKEWCENIIFSLNSANFLFYNVGSDRINFALRKVGYLLWVEQAVTNIFGDNAVQEKWPFNKEGCEKIILSFDGANFHK